MIMTLYGEDGYRLKEKLSEITSRFKEKFDTSGMNSDTFVFGKVKEGDIMSAVGSPPFLAERRLVLIEGLATATTRKADAQLWAERLGGRGDETLIILVDTELTAEKGKKNKLFAAFDDLEEKVHAYMFHLLSDREVAGWVQKEVAATGVAWAPDAVRELVVRAGADTWRLHTEIQKVSAAADMITIDHVKTMVAPAFDDTLFKFLDAVRVQNGKLAAQLLTNELDRGTAPGQLITMLCRETQLLAELRAYAAIHGPSAQRDAARDLGVHPFVVKKTMSRAVDVSESQLAHMVNAVLEADRRLKTTGMQDRSVIEQLVVDLVT